MLNKLKQYFSDVSFKSVNTKRPSVQTKYTDLEYSDLENKYFKLMPDSNLIQGTHKITLGESGTYFINLLFNKYVTKDTFVISTPYEHGSVKEWLDKIDNKWLLRNEDFYNLDTFKLLDKINGYKDVFVYIIGTQISTGQITPQEFFIKLKDTLDTKGIKYTLVLDDVHGMFFVPRDYSIFNYVLYTAHAIIPAYEMGLLISKDGEFGKKIYDWLDVYYDKLVYIKGKFKYYNQFKDILAEYFNDCLDDTCRLYTNTVKHIFALQLLGFSIPDKYKEELKVYGIMISDHPGYENFIRIRIQEFLLQDPEQAYQGLEFCKKILFKALTLNRLKGEYS